MANIKQLRGVPTMIESRNCSNCGTFLIPGINCRVRITKTDQLSNKSRSLISTNTKEINSLEFRLKPSPQQQQQQQSLSKNSNKLNNSITRVCLKCNKLNPLKGETISKRKQRKLILKEFKNDTNNKNINKEESKQNDNNKNININNINNININNNNNNNNNNINNKNINSNNKNNNKNNNNNNNNKNSKIKVAQAGSKNLANKKEDNLKDFLSGMGLLK
ncbi:hypothetical protein DICPUDRAFT_159622 [Dictyostelium purpureum]|uniref:Uncharacterized protein n=1 Tax=Dictyostelium purpureum TaxID=5786 RepID=F1A4K1_DICPU|nr:uncharacterized protein DICPUDRAFT_159622 [Dictyostelium purpureum]EGC28884.1 hypothetical protein DICPUDRAFT_159622 [Dictyostelium purpureum]|eukprot:XP_003294595.1 hypothetical protein DICPUDRAFT_159622 [Dictyostelium purpureum]